MSVVTVGDPGKVHKAGGCRGLEFATLCSCALQSKHLLGTGASWQKFCMLFLTSSSTASCVPIWRDNEPFLESTDKRLSPEDKFCLVTFLEGTDSTSISPVFWSCTKVSNLVAELLYLLNNEFFPKPPELCALLSSAVTVLFRWTDC